MRSAVSQAAPIERRLRAHEALAEVLSDQPDRRVWHRAALISGQHESIAVELEQSAARARRRGAAGVAVLALRRAADLSSGERRLARVLSAAALAFELGQVEVVTALLRDAERLDPGPIERARITWIDAAVNTVVQIRPLGGTRAAWSMIEIAEEAGRAGDRDLQIELLWLAALRASWFGLEQDTSTVLLEAVRRVGPPDPADPRVFITYVYADPFSLPAAAMDKLRAMVADRAYDRQATLLLGPAAFNAGAFDLADVLVREAVDLLRDGGRLGYLPRMLTVLGIVSARLADWNTAIPAADAVVSMLGLSGPRPDGFSESGLRAIVDAAQRSDTSRILIMSGFGVGESLPKASWLARLMYNSGGKAIYADKAAGEKILTASGLDWTLAYPVLPTNKPKSGAFTAIDLAELEHLPGLPRVSRADVAGFLLDAAAKSAWSRRTVVLTNHSGAQTMASHPKIV
jgi:putative NADH-flavin reductase